MELTASRALVHYDGWASRWDEWILLDSNRIVRRGEGTDKDGSSAGKDSEVSGKRRTKGSSGGVAGSTETDEVEWFYSERRVFTSAPSTGPEDDWLPHSSLNNSKLEQAYLALQASSGSASSSSSLSSSTSASTAPSTPLTLRSARQSFDVDVASMTQVDSYTGQLFYLKRRSVADNQSFSFLEDVHWAVTGSQLLCALPALCPPNGTRRPVLRLFELPADGTGDVRWLSDVRLFVAQARSLPSSLSSAFTHASHQADAQLSALCYDSLNDELLSYHSSEQIIRRWRNAGPRRSQHAGMTTDITAAAAARVLASQAEEAHIQLDSGAVPVSSENVDVGESRFSTANTFVLPTFLSLSAKLLLHVSHFCHFYPPPVSSSAPSSVQPFCIDVHVSSFSPLHRLLAHCWHRLQSADPATSALLLSCTTSLLRLLEANLLHVRASMVDSAEWSPVIASISELLIDMSSSSSANSALSSLRVLSDDCLLAGFSSFFPSAPSLVPFLCRRLSVSSFRQRLLDWLSSSDRLMVLFPLGGSSEQLSSLLTACLQSCKQEALDSLDGLSEHSDETAQSASKPQLDMEQSSTALLLSSALQLTLRLQRYLLSVTDQSNIALTSLAPADGGSPWVTVFRLYCQQLASLCSTILSSAADRIAANPSIALLVSGALTRQATGVLLPSLLVSLCSRPADMQAMLGSFLPLLQQLDRINRAVHASSPTLSSELCLSAATLLSPLPSQFPSTSIESPHPYTAGTIDRQLSVPSSSFVAIDFSPLCCSRNANDALKLSQQDGWSLVCSGGSGGVGKGWPRWMVRRRGCDVAVYWQVEPSKAEAKDAHKGHGNDWGWRVTLFGFNPHPLPRMKCGGKESELDVLFDLAMSGTFAVVRSLRPSLLSTATSSSDIAAEWGEWNEQAGVAVTQPASAEDRVATAVDLSLLSAGLTATDETGQSIDMLEQQQLVDELLHGSDSSSLASQPSPATQPSQSNLSSQERSPARLLLEVLSSHISGRPAMTAAMRRIMQPVEAAVLATLLVHSRLLPTAVALVRALQAEPSPSPSPASASVASPSTKRVLTDTQRSLIPAFTPVVQSGLYRVVSWLLHRAQLDKRWQLLVDDAAQHILCHQQLQRHEQPEAEPNPAHGVTVQSLLLAAAASNRAPFSELPADLELFIVERLNTVSADNLKQLAAMQSSKWRDGELDDCVAQLATIVRKSAVEAAKAVATSTSVQHAAGSLERLAARLCSMAAFLCAFQPSAAAATLSSAQLVSALSEYLFASCSSVTPEALSAVLRVRVARSHDRAVAYGSLTTVLSCTSIPSSRDALLASLPSRAVLVDDLQGCSEADLHAVYERYTLFVGQLLLTVQQSAKAEPATPPSAVSIDCLLQHANALTSCSSPPLSVVTSVVDCLLSLHLTLSPYVALLVNPLLPPLSSTLLFSSISSALPLCSYVLTDSNHTDLAIYQCKTCGFIDGKVICGSCARSCHAGHDVSLLKQGTAFCDCWLFSGDKCAGMQWSKPARQRRQLLSQLDKCRMAAADLVVRAMEETSDRSEATLLSLQCAVLQHISVQAARCDDEQWDDALLHSLLACSFRVRHRLLFSDVGSLDNSSSSNAASPPACFSSSSSFGAILLRVWLSSSLRCQRLALRLLTHLLSRTEPSRLATCALPSSFPFPNASVAVSAATDGCALLLTALLTSVGDAVLHLSHGELIRADRSVEQRTSDGACFDTAEAASGGGGSSSAEQACQLLLCRPFVGQLSTGAEPVPSFPNTPVSSFVSSFVERCGVDVLHYQHIQALLDASTSADGSLALTQPASAVESSKAQLDGQYRKQLARALSEAGQASVFEGQRHLCEELGAKLAVHGLLLRVEECSELPGNLRNAAAVARYRGTQGWQRRRKTGRQSLSVATELIILIRTLLLSTDSSAGWQQLTEQSLSSHLAYLTRGEYVPLRVDGLLCGWRMELSAAIGALAVATGSTGYELPTLGAAVRLTNRDSSLDDQIGPTQPSSPPSTSHSVAESVSSIASALCSPFSTGRLVYVDEGGSEARVVRDGDDRRAGERVHWTRLVASLPAEVADGALLRHDLATLRLSMVESAVHALTAVASAPSRDVPAHSRALLAMLQTRLLRLVSILVVDSQVALHLLTRHSAMLDKVIVAALSPAVTVELRTVTMECSRAMEVLADLTLDQCVERQRAQEAPQTQRSSQTVAWRRDAAVRCLFTDHDCTVLYSGHQSSNPIKRMKVNIDELLPTLLTSTHPWLLAPATSSPSAVATSPLSACYFEIAILSEVQSLSIGVCPLALPSTASSSSSFHFHGSAAPSSSLSSSVRQSVSSSSSGGHLHGWSEGSVVYCNDGSKARFWHAVKACSSSPLHVHDLLDVRDSTTGKWQQAVVAAESEDSLRIHYLQWDQQWDVDLPRDSDRIDTFLSRTRYTNRTAAEQRAVSGQLWREQYAQPFNKGDVVGCGYSEQVGGVFFTLNGRYLGVSYRHNLASRLLPSVCLHDCDTKITANFSGPFLYDLGSEHAQSESEQTDKQLSEASEAMWTEGGGSDISSSLRLFNDPSHTAHGHVIHRLVEYKPLPSASLYRRHELADEMRRSGLFPDLTVAQLLLALEMTDDELQRAMELAYCQSSLLASAATDDDRAKKAAGSSTTPVAPLFSPAARTMFPTTSSAVSTSSSFFSGGPFNSASPGSRGPRMSAVPRRTGLLSASSFSSAAASSSSSSLSSSSSVSVDEDGFDDFLFDDESVRGGGVGSSGSSPPPSHSTQHAYTLDSLSGGARSVNHFYASESNELQFMAHRDRSSNQRAEGGESGGGERLLPFDIPPQSALDVLQLLESIRRPSQDTAVMDVLQQLRQLSSSSEALLFLSGARAAQSSDGGGGLLVMAGPSSAAAPAAINRTECVVGTSVRISANAKSVCIGSLPSTGHGAVLWCDEMDDLIGRVGQISAVDWSVGLVRVQCVDHERGVAKELWWPPAALSRLITLRRRGYVAGNHPLVILPHLLSLHNKLLRHTARQLLIALLPHVAQLTARSAEKHDREMVRLKASFTQPTADDEEGEEGEEENSAGERVSPTSPSLYHSVPLLARETLMVWALRALHPFMAFDTISIVQPPTPYTAPATKPTAAEAPSVQLLAFLSSQYPQLAAQCLRHTQHMIAQSVEIDYHGSDGPQRDPPFNASSTLPASPSTSSSTGTTLLYRTVHVPYACCLIVTFVNASVAAGALLSFYGAAHYQRLLLQIRGQRGGKTPIPSSPFIVPSNTVWIALTSDAPTASTAAESLGSVRLLVTPVSEQLSAGLWLAQHQLNGRHHTEQLRPLYDSCMELLALPLHVPAFVRVPVLRLAIAVIRSSPRGSLSDFQSALPLFREMLTMRSDSERDTHTAAGRRPESSRREKVQLYAPLLQLLFELHCAIVAHFHSSAPVAAAAIASHSVQQLVAAGVEAGQRSQEEEPTKEEEERKLKNDEELLAEADGESVSRSLSHYLTAEYERLSSPLGLGDVAADVTLDSEFSFPQWFVDGCSVLLSLRAVLSGDAWMIAADTRRRTSSIGVVTADGRADVALPTYRPWRSGADWFDASERQQQVTRRCLPIATYEQLAAYMDKRAEQLGKSTLSLNKADVVEDESFPSHHPLLRSVPMTALLYAATCLQSLNALLADSFPLFDLSGSAAQSGSSSSSPSSVDSVLSLFSACRGVLFASVKLDFFHFVLSATAVPSSSVPSPHLRINRLKAAHSLSTATVAQLSADRQKDAVSLLSESLLGQTYRQLKGVSAAGLRRPRGRGGAPHVAFNVQFEGESVLGQAGPYRQLFNDLSIEMQSQQLPCPLFVPTPNHRHQLGEQRHLYMPNPAATSPAHLELYEHIGRLMSVACRTRVLLSLDLPSLFWKQLAAQPVGIDDLREVDSAIVDGVLLPAGECSEEDDFARFSSSSLTFPVTRSDQSPVTAVPLTPVTLDTLPLYVQQLLEARLSECRQQVDAIRRGMSELLPVSLFSLLSPTELSALFCGSPSIDVELLSRHTEYSGGLSSSTRHIEWFWSCLREMSDEQRRQFVQFAYAQQRLPSDDSGFDTFPKLRMLIKPARGGDGDVDAQLPHSDVCFFNVELPAYSSQAIMRQRLLQACEMGQWGLSGDEGALHDAVLQTDLSATHSSMASPPPPPLPLPDRRAMDSNSGTGGASNHSSTSLGTEMQAMNSSSGSLLSASPSTNPFASLSSRLSARPSARTGSPSSASSTVVTALRGESSAFLSSPSSPSSDAAMAASPSSSPSSSSAAASSSLSASSFGSALTSSFRSFFSRSSPAAASPSMPSSTSISSSSASPSSRSSASSSSASAVSSVSSALSALPALPAASSSSFSSSAALSGVAGRDFSPTSFADSLLDERGNADRSRRRSHDLD